MPAYVQKRPFLVERQIDEMEEPSGGAFNTLRLQFREAEAERRLAVRISIDLTLLSPPLAQIDRGRLDQGTATLRPDCETPRPGEETVIKGLDK